MMSVPEGILIFSGYNPRAVIAFCRVAHRCGVPFGIMARSSSDPILRSKYAGRVVGVRSKQTLAMTEIGRSLIEAREAMRTERLVLLPSTESLNRFALKNREALSALGCDLPLVDEGLYATISDKYSFDRLCEEWGIQVPGELAFSEVRGFPVVAKPKRYSLNPDYAPRILCSRDEWAEFMATHPLDDFYVQEFVTGDSFYLLFYFGRDRESFFSFSQRNLVQQPGGKSILAAVPAEIHREEVASRFARMFRALGFWGLVMVEVRKAGREYVAIEANPRLWGPSQLFVDNGVPFFEHYLEDMGFHPNWSAEQGVAAEAKPFFWFGGLLQVLGAGGQPAYHTFSEHELMLALPALLSNDVYLREDTQDVFREECGGFGL